MDVKYGKMTEECVKIFHRSDISASKIQKSETEALRYMAQIYASKTNEIQKYETEHENEVRHLAGECMVLLENDGVLPFSDKIKKIALYGTGARHTVK